jgi:hypothetical protein
MASDEQDFQTGEIVNVTIEGVFVQGPVKDGYLTVNVGCDEIRFGLGEHGVTVTRVAPAEWPPRPEDLWRDHNGRLWFGRSQNRFVTTGGSREETPDRLLADYGPLTLIHRERHDGGAQ